MEGRFARWKGILGINIVLCMVSCGQLQTKAPAGTPRFRDLPAYFAGEKIALKQAGLQYQKWVEQNGVRDSSTASDSNTIDHLLKPFAEINLNKPSLRDQYTIDSVVNGFTGARSLIYSAKKPDVRPQQVLLETDSTGFIQTVQIMSRTKNLLYTASQVLVYEHLKTMRVATDQKVILLSPQHLSVLVRMSPKQ